MDVPIAEIVLSIGFTTLVFLLSTLFTCSIGSSSLDIVNSEIKLTDKGIKKAKGAIPLQYKATPDSRDFLNIF